MIASGNKLTSGDFFKGLALTGLIYAVLALACLLTVSL